VKENFFTRSPIMAAMCISHSHTLPRERTSEHVPCM
jgi:hypothetical protein